MKSGVHHSLLASSETKDSIILCRMTQYKRLPQLAGIKNNTTNNIVMQRRKGCQWTPPPPPKVIFPPSILSHLSAWNVFYYESISIPHSITQHRHEQRIQTMLKEGDHEETT